MVPRAKASLNESTGRVMAACMALRLLSTIDSCLLLITVRVVLSVGRHGSGREAKPETPIWVGLWRPTNLATIGTCLTVIDARVV
jgi:hypothetical protein